MLITKTNITISIISVGFIFMLTHSVINKNTLSSKLSSNMAKIAMNSKR